MSPNLGQVLITFRGLTFCGRQDDMPSQEEAWLAKAPLPRKEDAQDRAQAPCDVTGGQDYKAGLQGT